MVRIADAVWSNGGGRGVVFIAHPSADVYGSDLQLLETVSALSGRHWAVCVHLTRHGPLVPMLQERGAEVLIHDFPILRRSLLTLTGAAGYGADVLRSLREITRHLRRRRPDVVLVNTVTIPVWLLAADRAGIPSVWHVHEAEDMAPRPVRTVLFLPAVLATAVVANSRATLAAVTAVVPMVRDRARVVYNGVAESELAPTRGGDRLGPDRPVRLVVVGRLSRIKGTDIAVGAAAILARRGVDVRLDLCGSVFRGNEDFEVHVRESAAVPELHGRVRFLGYVEDTRTVLQDADIVLVPSRQESLGNAAIEAMLAERPVVAAAVQGLREVVESGVTGLLVAPGDPVAFADAVVALMADPPLAARLAAAGRQAARRRFSVERYAEEITETVAQVRRSGRPGLRRRR